MSAKYLINSQFGAEDLEKATVAMIVASSAAAMEGETAMFLTGESVRLVTKGGLSGLSLNGYPSLQEMLQSYQENGGQLWVCPVCASARDIGPNDIIDGAEIAGAARTIGFVNEGAKILM